MTLHVCRDFLSIGNPLTYTMGFITPYYLAMFMYITLGYSVVGQTNFNIASTPLLLGSGGTGTLNQGAGFELAFLPSNGYTVSIADVGRILVLKSPGNPMINSGLFRVTGVDTVNNWLYINYRAGALPPVETGMTWGLFASESVWYAALNFTGNGIAGTYQGQGTATQNRIILQSPSSTGYQARLAIENDYDTGTSDSFGQGSTGPANGFANGGSTVSPGYGGNSRGDFAVGGPHVHVTQFFNNHVIYQLGLTVGWFPHGNQARIYMWGDDSTGTVFAAARTVIGGSDSFVHFGLPEDEEVPLPANNASRLFVTGDNWFGGSSGIYWACGNTGVGRCGATFGLSGQPVTCIYSLYNATVNNGEFSGQPIRSSLNAGDNAYISATELVTVDLLAGTLDNTDGYSENNEVWILEGRRLGRCPMARLGRTNYGNYQTTTDPNQSWFHLVDGIYMPWQGPILP